jgi:site-specific DNA recombinase
MSLQVTGDKGMGCTSNIDGWKKAVVYARVSSKEQEQEGYSIPAQLKLLKDYAGEHRFEVVQEYIDVETAKRTGRKCFTDMLSFLRSQAKTAPDSACRIILVEKTDRLYRNLADWVKLDDLDVEIHFVKEGVTLSRESRSSEKFMHGIKVLMAKNYIDNLSEETKKGMLEKAEQGIYPSQAPIGYINVECQGKRYIQPDPDLAPLVRRLYEWYSTGNFSLVEVTRKIKKEGLSYRKSGAPLQKSLVYKVLTNPIYYGDFNWKGTLYRGVHDPIVSKELWDRVQEILNNKGRRNTKQSKHNWAFSGLLSCGHCGLAMTPEIKKGKYIYYHCTGYKGKCPEKYVREEEVACQIGEAIKAIRMDDDVMQWIVAALKESHKDEKRYHDEALAGLQRQYTKFQNRIDIMYEDKLDGRISAEMYDRKSREYREEQLDIRRKMESHEAANLGYIDSGVRTLELAQRAYSLYEQQDVYEKRKLADFVLSNSLWKDGMLVPSYRKPFDLIVNANKKAVDNFEVMGGNLSKKAENEIWLPGVDSNH